MRYVPAVLETAGTPFLERSKEIGKFLCAFQNLL